jgi:serine protease Do
MQDEQNEEFDFIKEKIKNKPVNKKRIATHIAKTAGLAVVFGFVACMVFTVMQPIMQEWFQDYKNPVVSIPSDEKTTETEKNPSLTKDETEQAQPSTQIVQVPQELQLSDYQKLEDKLYAIGTTANRSIVTVTGVRSDTDWFNTPYETEGQASGVIIANNGQELYVMTEKKVITDVTTINVTFQNGTTVPASLKKYDGNTGIAILSVPDSQIDENTLGSISVAQIGNSLEVSEGNVVIAVGSPLGSNFTVLTGNITSVGNSVSTIDSNFAVLTTDMVGSTNGSGVLLNLQGKIIGLIMQNYSTASEQNTLTALSISELKTIIDKLSRNEDIPYLGLKVTTVTSDIEKKYDLPRGVYIKSVEMDSPALAAGLQSGDIVTEIEGKSVQSVLQYEEYVRNLAPKAAVHIKIMRQGSNGYAQIDCQAEVGVLQ